MKTVALFVSLFLISNLFAQEEEIIPITQEFRNDLMFKDFIKDSVSCIELISLRSSHTSKYYYPRSIIKPNGINAGHIRFESRLDSSKWNQLVAIFDTAQPTENGISVCYEPRNGILFYSKNGELISYLELCFECNMRNSTGIIRYGTGPNLTYEQYNSIKNLFTESGVILPESEEWDATNQKRTKSKGRKSH